jgi:ABC-type sugar transport system permease subunit
MLRTSRFTPWLYLTPMGLVLAFAFGYPLVAIFNFSLRRIRGASGPFIGLENYHQVIKDDVFHEAVVHNAILLLAVPIMTFIALILAVLLFDRPRGWRTYRSLLYVPFILATPVVGVIFSNMLQLNGVVNEFLRAAGLGSLALDWIGNPRIALWTVMGVVIWREVGFGIVLFLARLMSISEDLLDAARVDGAGWWQRLWHVIVPQMKSVIEFFVVVSIITMLAWVFSYVYVITHGGPGTATMVMELYIFNFAFRASQLPGIASAVAVILFLITLAFMLPLFRLRSASELEEMA